MDPQHVDAMLSLQGQAFIVLGAGQGIGAQAALTFAHHGASVLCVDHDSSCAERIAQKCGGHAVAADVTVRSDMQRVFDRAAQVFGKSVRGVVDIVGMVHAKDITEMSDEDWDRQFLVVFKHASLAVLGESTYVPKAMREPQGEGR